MADPDDLTHYMKATSRMRERAEKAETELAAEQQAHERTRAERDELELLNTAMACEAEELRDALATTEATLEARNREVGRVRAILADDDENAPHSCGRDDDDLDAPYVCKSCIEAALTSPPSTDG